MRTFFVVAAIAALAFAASGDVNLAFEGGVNLTNAEADFSFRYTSAGYIDSLNILGWSSVSIDASAADASAKANADIMLGGGVLPSGLNVPFAVLAYAKGEAAIQVDAKGFLDGIFGGSLNANFKGGVIGMAAIGMQEVDPDNKPVGDYVPLKLPLLNPVCDDHSINGDGDNLKGVYCTFSPYGNSADVTVTYVTSKKAGVLEYGETPVSPRSYEMIIEVKKFPLSNEKNHVRMDIGLLTASGAGDVDGSARVINHAGEKVYVAASTHAVVNGKRTDVDVKVESGSAEEIGTSAEVALKVALGGNIDAQIARVHFPAGATAFVYDPAMGAGCNVYDAGASTVALSLLVALLCVLVYMF
jgi:hypothetical protein